MRPGRWRTWYLHLLAFWASCAFGEYVLIERYYIRSTFWFLSTPAFSSCITYEEMASDHQGSAPAWEGHPRSWRRYTKEASWFVLPAKLKALCGVQAHRQARRICSFARHVLECGGESMANFLVRQTLGYEEFSEALARLWEEQRHHAGRDDLWFAGGLTR